MDTVEVKMRSRLKAFAVPERAYLVTSAYAEDDETLPIEISDLDAEALDALAACWLDHLSASVERSSPFRYERPATSA